MPEEIPESVIIAVRKALTELRDIEANQLGCRTFDIANQTAGRYEAEAIQNRARDIQHARQVLAAFRKRARAKDIDPEAIIKCLGGEPALVLSESAAKWPEVPPSGAILH